MGLLRHLDRCLATALVHGRHAGRPRRRRANWACAALPACTSNDSPGPPRCKRRSLPRFTCLGLATIISCADFESAHPRRMGSWRVSFTPRVRNREHIASARPASSFHLGKRSQRPGQISNGKPVSHRKSGRSCLVPRASVHNPMRTPIACLDWSHLRERRNRRQFGRWWRGLFSAGIRSVVLRVEMWFNPRRCPQGPCRSVRPGARGVNLI